MKNLFVKVKSYFHTTKLIQLLDHNHHYIYGKSDICTLKSETIEIVLILYFQLNSY